MKCIVIFPPQWLPFNPHLAPAAIHSILKNNGYNVYLRDLNIEFYNRILTPEFIIKSLKQAFDNYNGEAKQIFSQFSGEKSLQEYPNDFQKKFLRYREVAKIGQANEYQQIIANLPKALSILRDKKEYYNLELVDRALLVIKKATDILSAAYHPSRVNFYKVFATSFNDFETLKEHCMDKDGNIFYHYYEEIIQDLIAQDADYIGITISDYTQIIPGLTLAALLKAKTKAHINIGGNLFGRYTDTLINRPDFFNIFADTIIFNEGEKPVIELLRHLENKLDIEKVPNLIYLSNNVVKINDEAPPYKINELFTPEFSSLPLNLYYTPEVIFNLQASRDCYWRKCSFCTHYFGSKYAIKNIDKVVNEIKELQQKHNAAYFHFIDEAMSPAYLEKLSKKILEENLRINFYIYARLEKEFTPELFNLARKAGLRMILWGFESANERIYKLMNKGELTDINRRSQILKDAHESDIWNYLFVMCGFPSETLDEAKETVDFLRANRNIASFSTGSPFVLFDKAPILNDLAKYSITKVQKVRAGFAYCHRFETSSGMDSTQMKELDKYKQEFMELNRLKFQNSSYREKLFLYICRYGIENISKIREEVWI